MKIYTCKDCGAASSQIPFYSGVTNRCAECHKARVRANRAARADYYRAYDAKRFQDDPRVKERHAKYRSTPEGVASIRAAQRKWDAQNPDRKAAHGILARAVRAGRVLKPIACQDCGATGRIHGHHHDYARPLDVEWLCQSCHWQRHKACWKEEWPTRK